jgi:hypothetical protein
MYFELDISMDLESLQGESGSEWTVWRIRVIGSIPFEEIDQNTDQSPIEVKAPFTETDYNNMLTSGKCPFSEPLQKALPTESSAPSSIKKCDKAPRGRPRLDVKKKPSDQHSASNSVTRISSSDSNITNGSVPISKWSLSYLFSKVRIIPSAPSPKAVRISPSIAVDPSERLSKVESSLASHRFGLSGSQLNQVFPFHLVFTDALEVVQVGSKLVELLGKDITGTYLSTHFVITAPVKQWDWDVIASFTNDIPLHMDEIDVAKSTRRRGATHTLRLIGQLMISPDKALATYLCNPHVESLLDMTHQGIKVNDLSRFDCRLNMIMASEHLHAETAAGCRFQAMSVELEKERQRTIDFMKAAADSAEQALATKRVFVRYVR